MLRFKCGIKGLQPVLHAVAPIGATGSCFEAETNMNKISTVYNTFTFGAGPEPEPTENSTATQYWYNIKSPQPLLLGKCYSNLLPTSHP